MKTTATTEAVSLLSGENEHGNTKWRQTTVCAGQKPRADLENDLQTYVESRKSQNYPHRSWGY